MQWLDKDGQDFINMIKQIVDIISPHLQLVFFFFTQAKLQPNLQENCREIKYFNMTAEKSQLPTQMDTLSVLCFSNIPKWSHCNY